MPFYTNVQTSGYGHGCAVLTKRIARRSIESGWAINIVGEPIPLHQF